MLRSLVVAAVLACSAQAVHAGPDSDASPARHAPTTPPADAQKLASGIAWKTITAGHGTAHPGPHDWVMVYGARSDEPAELYYLGRATQVDQTGDDVAAALVEMRVGERRRLWLPRGRIQDVELGAIFGATRPAADLIPFPPPSDAVAGSSGIPSVRVREGNLGGVQPAPADRVLFTGGGVGTDGKPVRLSMTAGTQALADVAFAPAADALREMIAGEQRFYWVPAARNHGAAMLMQLTLINIEKRPQVPSPRDLRPPAAAKRLASGVAYVVLARGRGEPPAVADDVVIDEALWTDEGRTLAAPGRSTTTIYGYELLDEQLTSMRIGEKRRVWIPAKQARGYSENGRGVVAEIELVDIHRKIDLLPDGRKIELVNDTLYVVKGAARAPLPWGASHLTGLKLAADRNALTIETMDSCDRTRTVTTSIPALDARLENAAALALHKKKRYPEAAAGFRRAVALDPAFDLAYVNLASALSLGGDKPGAARALAPLAHRNPVWLLWRLRVDAELAGLEQEPDLAAMRASAPGHVDIEKSSVMLDGTGLLAAPVTECGWGSGDCFTSLEVLDVATGRSVTSIPSVMWSLMTEPTNDADVARSKAQAEQLLDDLGFAVPADVEGARIEEDPSKGLSKGVFRKAKLGLIDADHLRIVQGNTVLLEAPAVGGIERAFWVPSARLVVLYWGRRGSEGCEATDPQGVTVVRVP
jgi:hypothetical protein